MRKKLLRGLALILAVLCMVPTSMVAASGIAVDYEYIQVDVGETVSFKCMFYDFLSQFPDCNHCVISVNYSSRDGGRIDVTVTDGTLLQGWSDISVEGLHGGNSIITIQVTAGYSENPEKYGQIDEVMGQTSMSLPVNIIGDEPEAEIEVPTVVVPKDEPPAFVNPLKDIEVEKVPNPFTDVNEDDWYYESFIKVYAAGLLHGVDISPDKDGSQIIYMEKNALEYGEENVSMLILTKEEWIEREGMKLISNADGAQLVKLGNAQGATVKKLAQNNVKANVSIPVSRADVVQMLYNLPGNAGSYVRNPFSDIELNDEYRHAVLWAAENGVVNGYGDGKFKPKTNVTREQTCAIFVRYSNVRQTPLKQTQPAKSFVDAGSIQSYAKDAVMTCQRAGLIQGFEDGTYRPSHHITLNQITEIINNYCYAMG